MIPSFEPGDSMSSDLVPSQGLTQMHCPSQPGGSLQYRSQPPRTYTSAGCPPGTVKVLSNKIVTSTSDLKRHEFKQTDDYNNNNRAAAQPSSPGIVYEPTGDTIIHGPPIVHHGSTHQQSQSQPQTQQMIPGSLTPMLTRSPSLLRVSSGMLAKADKATLSCSNIVGRCRSAMEISCQTEVDFETVFFSWKVNNFPRLRAMAESKGLPPEGDVVTSPIYVDGANGQWWLRLYPFEDRKDHLGRVSLFLHTDRALQGDVFCSFQFCALDASGCKIEQTAGGVKLHKFPKSDGIRNYGFYDLIEDADAMQLCLVDDHILWLYCEVDIFNSPYTSVDDVQDTTAPGSSICSSKMNSSSSFMPQSLNWSSSHQRVPTINGQTTTHTRVPVSQI